MQRIRLRQTCCWLRFSYCPHSFADGGCRWRFLLLLFHYLHHHRSNSSSRAPGEAFGWRLAAILDWPAIDRRASAHSWNKNCNCRDRERARERERAGRTAHRGTLHSATHALRTHTDGWMDVDGNETMRHTEKRVIVINLECIILVVSKVSGMGICRRLVIYGLWKWTVRLTTAFPY